MFNSYSGSSSSSSSRSKSSANNSLVFNNTDASEAAEYYEKVKSQVQHDIIGKALVKVSTLDVGVFQMQVSEAFTFDTSYDFFYGFHLNSKLITGVFSVVVGEDIRNPCPQDLIDMCVHELATQVSADITKELLNDIGQAKYNLCWELTNAKK